MFVDDGSDSTCEVVFVGIEPCGKRIFPPVYENDGARRILGSRWLFSLLGYVSLSVM